jgi:hypothetical protein
LLGAEAVAPGGFDEGVVVGGAEQLEVLRHIVARLPASRGGVQCSADECAEQFFVAAGGDEIEPSVDVEPRPAQQSAATVFGERDQRGQGNVGQVAHRPGEVADVVDAAAEGPRHHVLHAAEVGRSGVGTGRDHGDAYG